jgi:hypothetical protein
VRVRTRRPFARAALAALLLLGGGHARAQQAGETGRDDLYQEALQSIAEGRKNDASATLSRLIEQEPLHAGAWLDLALIQCSLGHREEAMRLFAAIEERFAPGPAIIELIRSAQARGCDNWHPSMQWSLTGGRGMDRNVNQGANHPYYTVEVDGVTREVQLGEEFLPRPDQYTFLNAELARDISANGSVGFVQFQGRRHDRLSRFDNDSLYAGVETPWRRGRWTARGTALLGATFLGGQPFQRTAQLQARVAPPVSLPATLQLHLIGALAHLDYQTLANFDSRTADLRAQLSYRGTRASASFTAGYALDHALSDRPGGDRRGWLAALQARTMLRDKLAADLAFSRQTWHNESAYAPGVINTVRTQATHVLRGNLTYQLAPGHSLQLEARRVWNRENISIFQYNNRLLQLSWQWNGK